MFSENSFEIDRHDFNLNPYYEYKTDTDKLLIDFNYINFRNDNTNVLSDVAGSTIPFTNRKYIQEGTYNIKTYRLDYTKTLSDKLSLSFGSRYADVGTDNDLQSFSENTNSIFQRLNLKSILALFSIYIECVPTCPCRQRPSSRARSRTPVRP